MSRRSRMRIKQRLCIKQRSCEIGQCNKVGRRTSSSSMENVVLGRCTDIINIEARILKILLENKLSIPLDQNSSESLTSQKVLVLGL